MTLRKIFALITLILLPGLVLAVADRPAVATTAEPPPIHAAGHSGHGLHLDGHVCDLPFLHTHFPAPSILAPERLLRVARPNQITVNYYGGWSPEAQNAFQYAVNIWDAILQSNGPITIDAYWTPLGANVLGSAGPLFVYSNFPNPPEQFVWYPAALTNSLTASDYNGPQDSEVVARFNSDFDWYTGTDGQVPISQVDLVSVVLHELAHGFGFSGSAAYNDGLGSWGLNGLPITFDQQMQNGAGQSLLNTTLYPNPSLQLGAQYTSNDVWFSGANAAAGNNGGRARLYAPSIWSRGSSIAHLDYNTFVNTENALMVYALTNGRAIHDPGPVTIGLMQDIGWPFSQITPPQLGPLPSQFLLQGTTRLQAIDLWAYTVDNQYQPAELTYAISDVSSSQAGVSISDNRWINIDPSDPNWTGQSVVDIEVASPDDLTGDSTFSVIVAEELFPAFLPAVTR